MNRLLKLFGLTLCSHLIAQEPPLVLSTTIQLTEVSGGFNHHAADGEHHFLFVCASSNKTVEVVDLNTGKVVKSLVGEKPSATCFAPDLKMLCVSRGKTIELYDTGSFERISTISMPCSVDEMHYDAKRHQLLAGCMNAPLEGIAPVDLVQRKVLEEIKTPHPQGFALEDDGDRVFVCTPGADQISVVDRKKSIALPPWKLKEVQGDYSVAYDPTAHRLFVGCRSPAKLLVFDTGTGKIVTSVDIGEDTDDLSFDAVNRRIYVACGEGVINVIQQDDQDHYRTIANVQTADGARNSVFIPETGEFCVTVPRDGRQPARVLVYRAQAARRKAAP